MSYWNSITLPSQVFATPAASILLPIALGTAVGFSQQPRETQKTYLALKQPPYRPPPQVFGPVWTALYGLMGYSAYRAWTTGINSINPDIVSLTKTGATLYTVQLGLNLVWMPLFFHWKQPIAAMVDISALTVTTAALVGVWAQVDEVAAWALAPYLGWLGFATYLNAGVGYLNNWSFDDKEVDMPPSSKLHDTKYVDEK
jgi:benzodiazapine receptor